MNIGVATGLLAGSIMAWLFPGFSGFFSDPIKISPGETAILSSVFLVGAIIVWMLPHKPGA